VPFDQAPGVASEFGTQRIIAEQLHDAISKLLRMVGD
jgi:hypothetical protein